MRIWTMLSALPALLLLGMVGSTPAQAQTWQGGTRTITCESPKFRYQHCSAAWRDARIVRQISKTRCVRGQNWGVDRGGIWVDNGCAAVFEQGRGGGRGQGYDQRPGQHGGWQPGPDWDRTIQVRCESPKFQYRMCQIDTGRGSRVRLVSQISKTQCMEGRNWGWNRAGVWVDDGCAAVFAVERRWR